MKLNGMVISGSKNGSRFINLPWVRKQIIKKLHFDPYAGTLNLKISNKNRIKFLQKAKGIIIKPEPGYTEGKCFRAMFLNRIECAVVLPNVPNYPSDLLEIIAPINLRKNFSLKDRMIVQIDIRIE
jgi:riboflavin kinase